MKRNRREEYTINVIKETFLSLLENNRVEKITIGELCGIADINRSTFYRHYLDIYDLFDEVCDDAFRELFASFVSKPPTITEEEGLQIIKNACELTVENKDLYHNLIFMQPSSELQNRLSEAVLDFFVSEHSKDYPEITRSRNIYHYQFLVSGILGIWLKWLQNGCLEDSSVIAETVMQQIITFYDSMARTYAKQTTKKAL